MTLTLFFPLSDHVYCRWIIEYYFQDYVKKEEKRRKPVFYVIFRSYCTLNIERYYLNEVKLLIEENIEIQYIQNDETKKIF